MAARIIRGSRWWPRAGSNRRHLDFQSSALPTELPGHRGSGRVPDRLPVGQCVSGSTGLALIGLRCFLIGLSELGLLPDFDANAFHYDVFDRTVFWAPATDSIDRHLRDRVDYIHPVADATDDRVATV